MYFVIFRVKQQLFLDHSAVLSPNTLAPFVSVEDAVRHLLPYHTCARALPSQTDFISGSTPMKFEFDLTKVLSFNGPHCKQNLMKMSVILCAVDKQFECFSVVLLKRTKDMLNKYRQLLLSESQVTDGFLKR